ncbi:MAG TPA: uracil-DNA glycosylase [Gammaproteobacteria bacterium]|nr:uracil-DNA glycosylase [Gammaproteobacteria bacterium]
MSARAERYLAEIGITVYKRRRGDGAGVEPASGLDRPAVSGGSLAPSIVAEPAAPASNAEVWERLEAEVRACTRCGLHKTRTQTVFGVGRRDAELLVIGEAPGADEDRQGEPFVGRAGQLLNAMLRAINLPRKEVYIANILKCRPPGNRDPQPDEASTCTPYLSRQIALVRPRAILAVGRIAAQWLLQSDAPIGRLRGRVFQYGEAGTPLIVTYHPAYLLRSPLAKATAWTDLCMVKDLLQRRA